MSKLENLKQQYQNNIHLYNKLCDEMYHQIEELIKLHNIKLAFPIEYRIKELTSVMEKAEKLEINEVSEINDIVGLRIITIFETDIKKVCNLVEDTFVIIRKEDTRERLKDNQFGYGSIHYEIKLHEEWCNIPSLMGLKSLQVELQVRTAAQHIWAISSHILQYKKEQDVPDTIKRTINRVAALLELVDLEFIKVLEQQKEYLSEMSLSEEKDELLNIENMKYILKSKLPKANEDINNSYSELLGELFSVGIDTTDKLISFIDENLQVMLDSEREVIQEIQKNPGTSLYKYNIKRFKKGVFYTFVGLIRQGLSVKYLKEIK